MNSRRFIKVIRGYGELIGVDKPVHIAPPGLRAKALDLTLTDWEICGLEPANAIKHRRVLRGILKGPGFISNEGIGRQGSPSSWGF